MNFVKDEICNCPICEAVRKHDESKKEDAMIEGLHYCPCRRFPGTHLRTTACLPIDHPPVPQSSSPRWVQHVSKQGHKWELYGEQHAKENGLWLVRNKPHGCISLPVSEYIPCDPPEVWKDVTKECECFLGVIPNGTFQYQNRQICFGNRFRIRKVQMWRDRDGDTYDAFIVEQRQ